jgi:hypothetical protein
LHESDPALSSEYFSSEYSKVVAKISAQKHTLESRGPT